MLLNVFGSSLLLVCYDTSAREMNNGILGHKIILSAQVSWNWDLHIQSHILIYSLCYYTWTMYSKIHDLKFCLLSKLLCKKYLGHKV